MYIDVDLVNLISNKIQIIYSNGEKRFARMLDIEDYMGNEKVVDIINNQTGVVLFSREDF